MSCVVWLTGLPSAGKSTVARAVATQVKRCPVEILDGDTVREWLSPDLGFSREARDQNVQRVAHIAALLAHHGVVTICALVSPYAAARNDARMITEASGSRFIEVFVDGGRLICEGRDVKGLYAKARSGELQGLTGVDAPYEPPKSPDLILRTSEETIAQSASRLFALICREDT